MNEHIFQRVLGDWERHLHHHDQQPGPETTEDNTMALADIGAEIKQLAQGQLSTLDVLARYLASPVIQAYEASTLTPEDEQLVAGFIKRLDAAVPVPAIQLSTTMAAAATAAALPPVATIT